MVRSTLLATAALTFSLTATEASAHSGKQHHTSGRHRWHHASYRRGIADRGGGVSYGGNVAAARAHGMAWCGAEMADELGIHGQQGRELWLARNWAHVGTPASAHVGAVVVWSHHVGQIVGQENGQWVVRSGNDGGGVRSRARSLAGAIAIRDVGIGFGDSEVAGIDEQARGSVRIADIQRQHHYQRISRNEHRTPLWMHDETVQPDRYGAASAS